ncbi:hypothetical protein ABZW30_23430 [Kitasatospora sp. NPDC004669]|uniref:hypothetical protein n=1 Tax=Kitasatospora sp. NPDC004669 TaxID=3154555 RepID=UPI0033B7CD42
MANGCLGALTGSLFGALWFVLGLASVSGDVLSVAQAGGALLAVLAVLSLGYLAWSALSTPAHLAGAPASAKKGTDFTFVVIVEAIALGVGNTCLRNTLHRPELMYTWSALVVGVHFLPLAKTFATPVLRWIGAAMILVALATPIAAQLSDASDAVWQAVPGLGCAAVLWGSAIVTAVRQRRLLARAGR